jgi:hypothetical protein
MMIDDFELNSAAVCGCAGKITRRTDRFGLAEMAADPGTMKGSLPSQTNELQD